MGVCCGKESNEFHVALKCPNGTQGLMYQPNLGFIECEINTWLDALYRHSTWHHWVAYNDETSLLGNTQHKKGHCKGLVAWNMDSISWLIHSVPNFPRFFTGTTISSIEPSETIYGQSFVYVTMAFSQPKLIAILNQLQIMQAHVFMEKGIVPFPDKHKPTDFSTISISERIVHIAKPPSLHMDVYQHLLVAYPGKWRVQTWKRGHHVPPDEIEDIEFMKCKSKEWKTSQDHSKWGINEQECWIGDLNRMTSQESRGGGGLILKESDLVDAFRSLTVEMETFEK